MFKSWKTTFAGLISIGCVIGSIFAPEFAIPLAKIGAVASAGGLFLAKDHSEKAEPEEEKTQPKTTGEPPTMRLALFFIFACCLAFFVTPPHDTKAGTFIGAHVNNPPLIFTGNTNPGNFACGIGSFYVNKNDTNVPTLWIKTSTNGFAAFISSNSIPSIVNIDTANITNLVVWNGGQFLGGGGITCSGLIECNNFQADLGSEFGGSVLMDAGSSFDGFPTFGADVTVHNLNATGDVSFQEAVFINGLSGPGTVVIDSGHQLGVAP